MKHCHVGKWITLVAKRDVVSVEGRLLKKGSVVTVHQSYPHTKRRPPLIMVHQELNGHSHVESKDFKHYKP